MKKHNKSTCWLYQKRLKILITHPQLIEKDLRRNGVAHDKLNVFLYYVTKV